MLTLTCVFSCSTSSTYSTVVIESISDSFFSVDSIYTESWTCILCISTSPWPSWLSIITQWFNTQTHGTNCPDIIVISPSREYHNLFGINRQSHISWIQKDLNFIDHQYLSDLLAASDMCFFDGLFSGLTLLYHVWDSTLTEEYQPSILCAIAGHHRIRTISQFA